jgi:hypothetical protein
MTAALLWRAASAPQAREVSRLAAQAHIGAADVKPRSGVP